MTIGDVAQVVDQQICRLTPCTKKTQNCINGYDNKYHMYNFWELLYDQEHFFCEKIQIK